jgi:hypothetical protein
VNAAQQPPALTPYPLFYLPPSVQPPACCPHRVRFGTSRNAGPDGVDTPEGRVGGSGHTLGGSFRHGDWRKSPAGWWLLCGEGHQPQHLVRMPAHPAIRRWRSVDGVIPGQRWRVPVLLTLDQGDLIDATDRRWTADGWQAADDLRPLLEPLLAVGCGILLDPDPTARNAAMVRLAVGLLAVGHWIDADLLATTGWLSESLVLRVVNAALDREPVAEFTDPILEAPRV